MEHTLDARGLNCPLPLIKARTVLAGLAAGDVLVVLATDPEAPIDHAALAVLLDEDLLARARRPEAAPNVGDGGREAFARTLVELRDTAAELEGVRIWACAGAVEATGADRAAIEARLDGVMSTPRFLREVAGAEIVVV